MTATDKTGEMDLLGAEGVGARLIEIATDIEAMDRQAPGAFGDWGVRIGGTLFQVTVRVLRSHSLPAGETVQ